MKGLIRYKGYSIIVNYNLSITDMVRAGDYSSQYVNPEITEKNFSIQGSGKVKFEVVLVNFDDSITSPIAIDSLGSMGLMPFKIEHLLAVGAQHQALQRCYPIICLGSSSVTSNNKPAVPGLYWYSCVGSSTMQVRTLGLYDLNSIWHPDCRFGALRSHF